MDAAAVALASVLHVVDAGERPRAGVTVIFLDRSGATDRERTDARGDAHPRSGFAAVAADVNTADGTLRHLTAPWPARVVIEAPLAAIGTVRVATGSTSSLHRLPVPAAVLDRAALASSPSLTIDALLRTLPGIDRDRSNAAFTNYGQVRVSFAGAGADRGLVLVDGVPAQDGFGGQIDWTAYPAAYVERAELARGAASALYGSGAVGGVLELHTLATLPPGRRPDGTITLGAGTSGFGETGLAVRSSLGARTGAAVWTSSQEAAYRAIARSNASPIDGTARSQSDATALRISSSSGAVTVGAAILHATDAQNEGRPNYTDGRRLDQFAVDAATTAGAAAIALAAYARSAEVVNVADQTPARPGVLRYTQTVATAERGFSASVERTGARTTFDVRADLRAVGGSSDQRGPANTLQSFGSGDQRLFGVALQQTLRWDRAEVLAGARFDDVTFLAGHTARTGPALPARDHQAVSPRAAIRIDAARGLSLRLSAGGGFRAPYLNELVRGYAIGATTYAPNATLIPERSGSLAAGADVLAGGARIALDLVRTHVSDAIGFETISPVLQRRANTGHTRTDSLTLAATQPLGSCARLRANVTAQRAVVVDGTPATIGKRLPYVPSMTATLGLDAPGRGAFGFGIEAAYSGPTYADDLNVQPLGTALTVGARGTYRLRGGGAWSAGIDNAGDARFLSSIDRYAPPRRIFTELRLPLGARGTSSTDCATAL